jgi:Histidine kinase-, DNA gyrase B-, and HSP90-like ATPase
MEMIHKISIRPGVSILSILKHIEYDPWYALAEFVDNAIDSYLKYEKQLKKIEGDKFRLVVKIEFNEIDKKITVKDNAAGIHQKDYPRAFRAAEIPPDNSGLSEFGMGMKSAACWFSDYWSVRTTAIDEDVEKKVSFDLNKIFYDKLEELDVENQQQQQEAHYTIIELCNIEKMPIKKTKGKIKEHLASIYRHFTRNGVLELYLDNELLEFHDPQILKAPFPYDSNNPPILWKKEIDFEIDKGKLYVKGFVALRETMSNAESGFALFRRGRVIEGSGDQGFKPKEIMGELGSPEYKRIFGELHLEGFNVSFTKKGIKWDENMEIFLDLLKSDLNQPTFPLLKQAKDYRVKPSKADMIKAAETVVKTTVQDIQDNVQPAIEEIRSNPVPVDNTQLTKTDEITCREFEINFNDSKWLVTIELSYDNDITDWIEVGSHVLKNRTTDLTLRQVGVRMSLNHPFVMHFAGTDKSKLEPILRIAAVIGLAEEAAREAGVKQAGTIRMNLNKLLTAISKS